MNNLDRLAGYLTVAGAAAETGYNVQHLRRLCASGTIPAQHLGRNWIIARADLEHYVRTAQNARDKRYGPHVAGDA